MCLLSTEAASGAVPGQLFGESQLLFKEHGCLFCAFQMPLFGFPLQSPKIRNDFLNGQICFRSSLPVPETILQASAAQLKEQNYDQ